jgi:hypothetical protein
MFFGFSRTKSTPDVLMITGEKDDYLCDNKSVLKSFFVAPENSLRRLKRRGINVTELWLDDLGHEMSNASIGASADYLAKSFKIEPDAGPLVANRMLQQRAPNSATP